MAYDFTVGIDTGGTFTDSFVASAEGQHWSVKVPTTPHDLTVCLAEAIAESAKAVGLTQEQFLVGTSVIRFSSTIATNTALTLSGPKLGLIVSAGEEETLYGSGDQQALFQFIAPEMIVGIDERTSAQGTVEKAPEPEDVIQHVKALLEKGARLLVVSLGNSTANPANELAVLEIVNRNYPTHYLGAVPTLLSTHVTTVPDDARRTSAAVVNAYMHKQLARSLYRAEDDLRARGFQHPLLVVCTDGTVTRVAKTRALSTYQSGPAAGLHASALLSRAYGLDKALTGDVGGTSTDLGLVVQGQPLQRRTVDVRGLTVAQPSSEQFSIALGGGSLCEVADGTVRVGPESAGAAPGPACFGKGGRTPTPTDAWLLLGYLDPDHYLGGQRKLLPDLARSAVEREIAKELGISAEDAALAVKAEAEKTVAEGVTEILRRLGSQGLLEGGSPRDLELIAYGGAGGLLLPSVAALLGLRRVYLSSLSPVFSAFGVSTYDIEHRYEAHTRFSPNLNARELLAPLIDSAQRDIRGEGFDWQTAALSVALLSEGGDTLAEASEVTDLASLLFRLDLEQGSPVIVCLLASCTVPKPELPTEEVVASSPGKAEIARRTVVTPDGAAELPVYDRARLVGHTVAGPCIVESTGSTYLVPEDAEAEVDDLGTTVITLN